MNPSFICLFNKCIFIIDNIHYHKRLTLRELSDMWADNDDYSYGEGIKRDTFYNNIRMIEEMFHVIIECKNGYWYIVNPQVLEDDSTTSTIYRSHRKHRC